MLLGKIKEVALLKTMTIKEFISDYNREIDEAIERVRSGKFKTHEEVENLLGRMN